ncbi:MAG TPA: DUF3298 and DUF4163 domain-containing protein, partial [Mucilaginibacter sp.]|nr:DUF3298 and DUF4163 domain-containing protein [Mucilaginibacter sp.]
MMRYAPIRSAFYLLTLVGLASCQWGVPNNKTKPAITVDTLVYTYKTIKERASDCGNKPDSSCTVAKITYPIFVNQNALNDSVTSKLTKAWYNDKVDNTVDEQAKSFIKFYENDAAGKADHPDAPYSLESNAAVIRQDLSLLTIQIDRYAFTGGAHGSDYTGFINWNTKDNKAIELSDILKNGYRDKLTPIGEKIFRSQEKLSDTSSLAGYLFAGGKFSLNDNFLVTPIGIRFLYNEY